LPTPPSTASGTVTGLDEARTLFHLRPVRAAKVSEISESTASSAVPPEERVNFHIGNPVQDERLVQAFFRIALGKGQEGSPGDQEDAGAEPREDQQRAKELDVLLRMIRRSGPYMPRGGYLRHDPHEVITRFAAWLENGQTDSLVYDLGKKTGRRELILTTGGIPEALRVFFHALSHQLVQLPARVFLHRIDLPEHLRHFDGINVETLSAEGHSAIRELGERLDRQRQTPSLLILGEVLSEELRRQIRHLAVHHPLLIVEANDAPNSLSLAREARMSQRVLRLLTPAVLSPELTGLPTLFVAGNAELLSIIEVAHFQLKGTPSASEVEHLGALMSKPHSSPDHGTPPLRVTPETENLSFTSTMRDPIAPHSTSLEQRVAAIVDEQSSVPAAIVTRVTGIATRTAQIAFDRLQSHAPLFDPLSGQSAPELLTRILSSEIIPDRQSDLSAAFLSAFLKHHPEYRPSSSLVVSGSSRTALGLLGFHCGITEVVTPDLSWTYEHCFPRVTAVPLRDDLQLDVDAIVHTVEGRIAHDPRWTEQGAVAINNPHNATGQAFRNEEMERLLRRLLEKNVLLIDDLAYQNVVPSRELHGPMTLRQLASHLQEAGAISSAESDRVITVHSVSKTDCLAGSRLAVVEIRDAALRDRFRAINATIVPNLAALFLSYLFYRGRLEEVNAYWRLRNSIFEERMRALEEALENLPAERNRFGISFRRPSGSMYPLMTIGHLPSGLSLDWLSSGLARQGIGLLPLSAFARTEQGFEAGRKAFRLTLGGTDPAERLLTKTRRVLIDLNRLMAEEESRYNRKALLAPPASGTEEIDTATIKKRLETLELQIVKDCNALSSRPPRSTPPSAFDRASRDDFLRDFLPERLATLRRKTRDRVENVNALLAQWMADGGKSLEERLDRELYKDSLLDRQKRFRERLFDRTVHPTQMYSLDVETLWHDTLRMLLIGQPVPDSLSRSLSVALASEFAGTNVAVRSGDEGNELVLDLDSLSCAEENLHLSGVQEFTPFLSYWGDWDGSTRPSGQGHRLVASVLLENVHGLARLLQALLSANPALPVERDLVSQLERLDSNVRSFRQILHEITLLTHQLEGRYRGILPYQLEAGRLRRIGMSLHLARDPLTSLWQHNDRLERRMLRLRLQRKEALQYYFALNKKLRKTLHGCLPSIRASARHRESRIEAVLYRDLLKRMVITPRIHEKLITAQDPFAIDTTVHNITEINEISGSSGNPGMILALQISMSTTPNAMISLDRKLRARREEVLRKAEGAEIAPVWLIPLFEDVETVGGVQEFLGKIWEYALRSRRLNQDTRERFMEVIPEVFIAGSDLSQQVGQTAGSALFKQAKQQIVTWLAERGLVGELRIKMGSGEPMQRQGCYYAPYSGLPAFNRTGQNEARLAAALPPSAKKSTEYATTPLMGVFAAADFRTFQSNLCEELRSLPSAEYARLLYHVSASQRFYEHELARAAEPLSGTRLQFTARGLHELERLTLGVQDPVFDDFIQLSTENFRHIVYGKDEDVVGIHILSYFIARATPPLRDRPTFRAGRGVAESRGHQILERIAETIPLSKYGSLLRAIAHNQAQTALLGVNQLTTGMFRGFQVFSARPYAEGTGEELLADRILPHLPVYEILHSLRLYHDVDQKYVRQLEGAFPAGNSAFAALREDIDAMGQFLGALRKELVRRHGLHVPSFFDGEDFITEVLPALRPDLAVLLQPDLFNTDPESLFQRLDQTLNPVWMREVRRLLSVPRELGLWRERAWQLLFEPVFTRVQSFVELALALSSLAGAGPPPSFLSPSKKLSAPPFARSAPDDSMRQFLSAAFEYLTTLSQQQLEVPTTVVRALREVERIMKIEEQALSAAQQEELRYYLLRIARLAGENG
jgi:aspartate/methionine/tyrosine aminotransferase